MHLRARSTYDDGLHCAAEERRACLLREECALQSGSNGADHGCTVEPGCGRELEELVLCRIQEQQGRQLVGAYAVI